MVLQFSITAAKWEELYGRYAEDNSVPSELQYLFDIGKSDISAAFAYINQHPELFKSKKSKKQPRQEDLEEGADQEVAEEEGAVGEEDSVDPEPEEVRSC